MSQIDKNAESLADFDFDKSEDWFGESTKRDKKDVTSVMSKLKEAGIKNSKVDDDTSSESTKLDEAPDKKVEEEIDITASDFGDDEEEEEVKPKEKVKTEKKKEDTKVKKEEKVEKVEEEEEEEEEDDDEEDEENYTELAIALKEEGLFSKVELKEGKKLDKESFKDKFEEEISLRLEDELDSAFEEFSELMDDDGKKFISLKKRGVSTGEILRILQKAPPIAKLDVEDEAQVKKVILHHLTTIDGKDMDEAEDQYEYWKTGGKHVSKAEKYFEQDKELAEKEAKKLEDSRKANEKKKKEDAIKFTESLEQVITDNDTIKGIALSKGDKKFLKAYINKPSVELNGKIYPPLLAKINETLNPKNQEDWHNLILLAKLYKDDFKLPEVEADAENKVANRVIKGLDKARGGFKKTKNSRTGSGKSLADHF